METAEADLQGQMVASSDLIQALAEQNKRLILCIETLGIRMGGVPVRWPWSCWTPWWV